MGLGDQGLRSRLKADIRTGVRVWTGVWAGRDQGLGALTGIVYSWPELPPHRPHPLGSLPWNQCHWLGGWL
jgi:hypothetical protein